MILFWAGFIIGFCAAIGVAGYISNIEAKKQEMRKKRLYRYYRGRRKL